MLNTQVQTDKRQYRNSFRAEERKINVAVCDTEGVVARQYLERMGQTSL